MLFECTREGEGCFKILFFINFLPDSFQPCSLSTYFPLERLSGKFPLYSKAMDHEAHGSEHSLWL